MSRNTEKHIKGEIGRVDGKPEEVLFFIAVVPPVELQTRVIRLKEEVRDKFGSKQALNSPPHITLHMPFKWKPKKIDLLIDSLAKVAGGYEPFEIQLRGFNAFPPRVIYIDVIPNDELRELQMQITSMARRQLGLDNADYKSRGFHPHMTIAFRDLKKAKFQAAWEYFANKEFEETFSVKCLSLLKHQAGRWSVYREFKLG